MTLEDFSTLTELKDGLTSPDRVKELITVMHRENDSNVKNLSEATRQRSIVATTVAATENKNCLDLFIHLNGLHFFDMWLKDAQKLGNDNGNSFSEESIIALLRALERLPIDNERSLCSGIGRTVQNLVAHRSLMIRNRAKTLCDKWVLIQDNGVAPRDVESPYVVIFNSHVNDNDEKNVERPGDETMPLVSVDNIQRVIVNNEEINGRIKTDLVEMSTLSSHLEQIASSAEYENALESSRKTDMRGDEDEDMVDDGESSDHLRTTKSLNTMNQGGVSAANALRDPPEAESLKTSSNSESGNSNTDSTNCKESPLVDGSDKAVTSESEKTLSGERPSAAEPLKDAEQRKSFKADITASQVSEIAQESEANTERGVSGFDLNQDVCSEEVDNPINRVSSTVSIVSASRAVAVAASGLPSAPLQFEGTRGWKGSASTSAFRRIPDSSRAHNNKQRLDCLDIDLNVAEDSDDKMLVISGLPSGEESSVEAGPRRPERMLLDLNSIGDEGGDTVGLDWGRDGRVAPVNQNGWQSPSRSSSSSSKQPSLRNINLNLNDRPDFPLSNHKESVISIFGTKVEVKTKDSLPQPSGRILEPPVDFNMGRPGAGLGLESSINYSNPPFYGHNGFAPGAGAGAAMFFYGSLGGPIPYMVDSRGAPVVPQMMGSSQPPSPFIMNMAVAGSSSGSTEPGPLLHNFDLNTGLTIDGGNRETVGGLRQFFHHNGGSMDEQYLRANSSLQASSTSVVGGKRREPDAARWELFPVNKHPQPQPQPPWR